MSAQAGEANAGEKADGRVPIAVEDQQMLNPEVESSRPAGVHMGVG